VEVGIRDLRDHLSRYIEAVRAGDELVVTDHGTAVARIVPLVEARRIDQLIADGVVSPAGSRTRRRPRQRAKASSAVSALVVEQRR
jgi:prevent-host-death family protein